MTKQVSAAGGTKVASAMADQSLTNAGATGTRTATFSLSAQLVGVLVALRPRETVLTYDLRGNRTSVTSAGTTWTLTYDQANRLTSSTQGGVTSTYLYDADGLRRSKTVGGVTTSFAWNRSGDLPTLLSDGAASYIYGLGATPMEAITGSTVTYFHADQLGSIRALTNQAGTVTAAHTYNSYGVRVSSTATPAFPFLFAGEYTDAESGLVYLRARYYDPGGATFISRDPLEPITGTPYAYVGNNPLNGVDPTGLYFGEGFVEQVVDVGGDVVGGAVDLAQEAGELVVDHSEGLSQVTGGLAALAYFSCPLTAGVGCTVGTGLSYTTAGLATITAGKVCAGNLVSADCGLAVADAALSGSAAIIPNRLALYGAHFSQQTLWRSRALWNLSLSGIANETSRAFHSWFYDC